MSIPIAKCGNICNLCPLYKENLVTPEDKQRTAEGCGKYINWNPTPEKLKQCSGCQSEEGFIYKPNCKVRVCAIHNEIENCAYCSAFPCEDSFVFPTREEKEKELGHKIPDEDYRSFLAPWESTIVLKKLKKKIKNEEIKQMQPATNRISSAKFPEELKSLPKEEYEFYKSLYDIIISIVPFENISVARIGALKNLRTLSLSILWVFGLYGKLETEQEKHILKLHRSDYFENMRGKFNYSLKVLENLASRFREKGINLEIEPERIVSKSTYGGLMNKGDWNFILSFDDDLFGNQGMQLLKDYILNLKESKGKNGYRYFSRADMRGLLH